MHRFKVGQKVVALRTGRDIIKGNTYIVSSLCGCSKCFYIPCITLEEITEVCIMECSNCKHSEIKVTHIAERQFAPLQSSTDAIEYKMKVSIPELITLKQYQEQ